MSETERPISESSENNSAHSRSSVRWKMTALVVILIIFFIILAVFMLGRAGVSVKIIGEGDSAPDFTLSSIDGSDIRLSDYRGRVVMIHFWATWCPPCVEEMPTLERLQGSLNRRDFEILAISVDEGGAPAVTSFMKQKGLTLPVLLDPNRKVASLYGTFKFPETYVVDRNGIVRLKAIGPMDWTQPANIDRVRAIIEDH